MIPLIDGDIIAVELAACGQYVDEQGEPQFREAQFVYDLIDLKIREICGEVWSTEEPIICISNSEKLTAAYNRMHFLKGEDALVYRPNFRVATATVKPYKGNRKGKEKPYHFDNAVYYLLAHYNVKIANGYEADDLMAVYQHQGQKAGKETIICSRDKDLRIKSGNHYSWECGAQKAIPPFEVEELGMIELVEGGGAKPKKECKGNGLKFFYAQMLMGDPGDNIPGCPKVGAVGAFETLEGCANEEELFNAVAECYMKVYGDYEWRGHMLEQGRLLWMHSRLDADGELILWELPYDRED